MNSQEFDTFRAKVRFDPVEDLTINGSYWLYDAFFPSGGSIGSDDGQVAQGTVFDNGVKNELFGLTGEYDFGDVGVFYGYANNNFDLPFTGTFGGGALSAVSDAKTDSHEVRFFSDNDSNLQWTVGLYQRTATRSDNTIIEAFAINSGSEARSRVRAVFGEGTYSFGDTGFEATAGIRYFEEDRTGNESASGVVTDLPDAKFDNWNPRFSLAWAPNDDVNFYISAANGYRSGQLQAGSSAQIAQLLGIDLPDATEPDSIWSYEAGVKANLMDQKVTLEAAIFNSRWKDVASLQPLGATGLSGLVNTDGTETTGIEAAVTARPTEGLTLFVSGSYTDPEYTAAVAGTGIDAGDIVDGTSRFTANASIDYRRPLTDTMDGFGRIGWQHRSAQHPAFVPTNVPGDVIDIIDARLGVEFDKFRLALFADNLFNEDGAASYRTVTPLESTALRVRPRTIGVELSVNIGN